MPSSGASPPPWAGPAPCWAEAPSAGARSPPISPPPAGGSPAPTPACPSGCARSTATCLWPGTGTGATPAGSGASNTRATGTSSRWGPTSACGAGAWPAGWWPRRPGESSPTAPCPPTCTPSTTRPRPGWPTPPASPTGAGRCSSSFSPGAEARVPPYPGASRRGLEVLVVGQLGQGVRLQIPHPPGGHVELAPGGADRHRGLAAQPETEGDHGPLLVGEPVDGDTEALGQVVVGHDVLDRLGGGDRGQVTQARVLPRGDGLVEAGGHTGKRHRVQHMFQGVPGVGRQLMGRRGPSQPLLHLRGQTIEAAGPISGHRGHVDGTRLALHASLQGMPDPPAGVGRELVATRPVELLHGPDETERPVLDEVEQVHARALVALGPVHDQAQVGANHLRLGPLVALGDALSQPTLLIGRGKRDGGDLLQIPPEQIELGRRRGRGG